MTSNEVQGREKAREFRRVHKLGDGPLADLVELLANAAGIDVVVMDAADSEHGLTMVDPLRGVTVVAVATTRSSARQRSSMAHELAHVLWNDEDLDALELYGRQSDSEIRANAFARHLLLPLAAVRTLTTSGDKVDDMVSLLVQRFDVSPHIAAIQLREAHRVSAETCGTYARVSAGQLAARHGWLDLHKQRSETASRPRSPQRLLARATAGYVAGVISINELADWAGESPEELEADLRREGISREVAVEPVEVDDDPFPPVA